MSRRKGLSAYLQKYAESEASVLTGQKKHWDFCVAIPACSEGESFEKTLQSLAAMEGAGKTLLVLVVNGAESSPPEHHEQNERFLLWIRSLANCNDDPIAWGTYEGLDVCVVDRASPSRRLPSRQGVGLARKISVDIPAALYEQGKLRTPWVHTTDADVEVPVDYLSRIPQREGASAGLLSYKHVLEGDPSQELAMLQYESYLHYYTLGLQHAGSPYAYTAIGSTIVVHVEYYAAVRGFPKREAGEDFYLLNKLAKVGDVCKLKGSPILVRGRFSDRVPFGTGAALLKITGERREGEEYHMYDPRSFDVLKEFLMVWHAFAQDASSERLALGLKAIDGRWPGAGQVFREAGVAEAATNASKHATAGSSLRRRMTEWMDAFRTLRLMHRIRESLFPEIHWLEAVRMASFSPSMAEADAREICETLGVEIQVKEQGSDVLGHMDSGGQGR